MTIRWAVDNDLLTSFTTGNSADGDTFLLDGFNNTAAVIGLSDTTVMAFGYGDEVDENNYGPNSVIRDLGRNMRIEVSSNQPPNTHDTNVLQVYGFYWDQNSTLEQTIAGSDPSITGPGTKPTLFYQPDLWKTIRPDGHGGTMIGAGGVNIDLMYDTYIRPNQLLGPHT